MNLLIAKQETKNTHGAFPRHWKCLVCASCSRFNPLEPSGYYMYHQP
jgi:hypothetical protein